MIWLSVKRDFFIVEILLARSLLLKTLVLRGDYHSTSDGTSEKPVRNGRFLIGFLGFFSASEAMGEASHHGHKFFQIAINS